MDEEPAIPIQGVWLRREPDSVQERVGITEPGEHAVVLVRVNGRWVEVVRESAESDYSAAVTAVGIRNLTT